MPEGPVYTNECEECIYLGHFEGADLYYCRMDRSISIVTFGGSQEDYSVNQIASLKDMFSASEPLQPEDDATAARVAYLIAADRGLISWCVNDLYIPAVRRLYDLSVQLANHYSERRAALRVKEVITMMVDLSSSVLEDRKLVPECMDN